MIEIGTSFAVPRPHVPFLKEVSRDSHWIISVFRHILVPGGMKKLKER